MFFCFCLKGGLGYSLKEQRVLFSLLHPTVPGVTGPTIRACIDPNPAMSAIGAQRALLGDVCPGAAPKKTPRSFKGNKGSGWRQPQLLCSSLTPGTIKCSLYGKVSNIHIQFLFFLMRLSRKHLFSTKNEVKTKRWRKCKPEDVPNFFLSVCHCFGAKAASVSPSPWVLFCSTNNWGTRRRKYVLCPV